MDVDGLSTGSGFCMADMEARECRGDTKTPKVWSLTVYELAVLICSLPSIEIDKYSPHWVLRLTSVTGIEVAKSKIMSLIQVDSNSSRFANGKSKTHLKLHPLHIFTYLLPNLVR